MDAQTYIFRQLEFFSKKLKGVQFRYEYRNFTHIVEVRPLSIFKENDQYLLAEEEIDKEFNQLFPSEEILFISTESLTEIKNAEKTFGSLQIPVQLKELSSLFPEWAYGQVFDSSKCFALAA